jgi:ABC-type multidrug transport system fused ATPase/permease subunit
MNTHDPDHTVIRLEHVSRRYGAKLALDDVSISVPPGLVLGLVGANGAGKTPLIKHVLGLLRAQRGGVRVFVAKITVAFGALGLAWRSGQITWRFAAGLIGGWAALTSAMIWLLPTWQKGGLWHAAALAILVPLALALNRHR